MYFHLIGIKEKNWAQNELDLLLKWWDEEFIRKFLLYRWVVIVSLTEFKDSPQSFWNIVLWASFENKEIQIICAWDDLWDKLYLMAFFWLSPNFANFINNPIPDDQMQELIKTTLNKIQQEDELQKQHELELEAEEQKKYEESSINEGLSIINSNILHLEQIIKVWEWIIMWQELKAIEDLCNEMKKIRLWTNFNKMTSLILESQRLIKYHEQQLLSTYNSQTFLLDQNSIITNSDVISELSAFDRISEKARIQPKWLTFNESFLNILWISGVYNKLLINDLIASFRQTSFDESFGIVMNMIEYIVLTSIIVISILRVFWDLMWIQKFSLYLLPALWWLNLLVYLFNNLNLKWIWFKFLGFCLLVPVYWIGLQYLQWTFSI